MKTKVQILLVFAFILLCNQLFAQNLYKMYKVPGKSEGKRFEVSGRNFLSFEKFDSLNQDFRINLNADYRQWRFTRVNLFGGYVNGTANINTAKVNSDTSLTDQHYIISLY